VPVLLGPDGYYDVIARGKPREPPGDDTQQAAGFGAAAPPVDVDTTGSSSVDMPESASTAPEPGAKSEEGLWSFLKGAILGGFSDNDSWSSMAGSTVIGFIPIVGQIADIRDIAAAGVHVAEGQEGAWLELGASILGVIPGLDAAKGAAKGAIRAGKEALEGAAEEAVQKGGRALADRAPVGRRVPNPDGSRGGQAHRDTVNRRIEELKADRHTHLGGGSEAEEVVKTPGGSKTSRRPDITTRAPDGSTYRENVGRSTRSGGPVARERRALDDIEAAKGQRPGYTPYDR